MPPLLQFARYRDIAAELANFRDEIIVASAGLASSIQWAAAALGGRPVSMRLATLDTFARRVLNDCGEYPHVATDAERRLAMTTALSAIDDPMMDTRGMVPMMERSYRDVRDSGISLAEFERRSRKRPRTQLLIRAWRSYEQLIANLPAVDPADVLERAATLIENGTASINPQAVAGFYDMTGAQLRLISAIRTSGKLATMFIPIGDGDTYAFASRFVSQLVEDSGPPLSGQPRAAVFHTKAPKKTVEAYGSKEQELRAVCASIRELLDKGTPPNQIGITARSLDPDDVRLLQRFSAEHEFAISARNDLSLIGHRLGRGTATILRLRERNFPRADVIDILRGGYRPRNHVRVDRLDVATREARISGGRAVDIRNPKKDPLIEEYRAVVAELESLPVQLDRIAARFHLDTEQDVAAAGALDDIAALLARWQHKVDVATVIDLIANTTLPHPPPATRHPLVWAGDTMQFRGRSFDHLFVIRAQESTLPQRRVSDPLLPDSDRREIGMREIGDGRDEERLLFQLLLDGTHESVRFSFATSDAFGKILRPSRMVKGVAPALSRSAPAGEPALRASVNLPRQLQLLSLAGTRSPFDGYIGDMIHSLRALSPTELEDFGECPQKFLFKRILDAKDHDDPNRELQMHHREKGKLDHAILERFYRSLESFPPRGVRERLDRIVDELFDEEETRVPAFNRVMRAIERRATKRYLNAFVAEDIQDLLENGLQPKHFEYKFGPEPFVIGDHEVPITVKGVVDRIDQGADSIRIVDYKSGGAKRHENLAEKIERGTRLQLPLYAIAIARLFAAQNVSGAIKPLIPSTKPEKLRFDLAGTEARLHATLDLFVESMLRGRFPAVPEPDSCKYCPVTDSCRTKHSDAEQRALARFDGPRALLESLA
jgi:RecB family exonuclease